MGKAELRKAELVKAELRRAELVTNPQRHINAQSIERHLGESSICALIRSQFHIIVAHEACKNVHLSGLCTKAVCTYPVSNNVQNIG